jgi:heat shock protein HtpX
MKLNRANRATAHLYIANPFKRGTIKKSVSHLFSTHPPIEARIMKLRGF